MPRPAKGPRLGGGPAHERLLLAQLASQLFEHRSIQTTEAKAKRLRPVAERLVTFAKRGDLHARRRVMRSIGDKTVVHELFTEIAPLVAERQGGYTRIVKTGFRKGDNAPMAVIELVLEPVTPKRAARTRTAAASAPVALGRAGRGDRRPSRSPRRSSPRPRRPRRPRSRTTRRRRPRTPRRPRPPPPTSRSRRTRSRRRPPPDRALTHAQQHAGRAPPVRGPLAGTGAFGGALSDRCARPDPVGAPRLATLRGWRARRPPSMSTGRTAPGRCGCRARPGCCGRRPASRSSTSCEYFVAVAAAFLAANGDRPVSLQRFGGDVTGESYFSKNPPKGAPGLDPHRRRDVPVRSGAPAARVRRARRDRLGGADEHGRVPRVAVAGRRTRTTPTSCASTSTRSPARRWRRRRMRRSGCAPCSRRRA